MELQGKIALITGGSSGIGLASAHRFTAEGARVVIVSPRQEAVDAAVRAVGGDTLGIAADVSDLAALDRVYQRIGDEIGRLDIVFANAGLGFFQPLGAVDEDSFDRQFDVNVRGLFFTVQKALPLLSDGGTILLTSSIAHFVGAPAQHVYAATKAAVRAFARNWAIELKDRGIRVNCLSPGLVDTPIFGKGGADRETTLQFMAPLLAQMPLGRLGDVDEAANAALFLVSEQSSFITGSDLCVDGGLGQI